MNKQPKVKKNRFVQPPPGAERALGDALREIRKAKGFSQEQLALESGLDRTYVSLIERGAQSPTIRTLVKLAHVLEVRPSEIVAQMESQLPRERRTSSRQKQPSPPRTSSSSSS